MAKSTLEWAVALQTLAIGLGSSVGAQAADSSAGQPHTMIAQAATSSEIDFRIDSPRLARALIQLTEQSGLQLIYPAGDTVIDLPAKPLNGRYTTEAALKKLLNGTRLQYEFLDAQTISIFDPATASSSKASAPQAWKQIKTETNPGLLRLAQASAPASSGGGASAATTVEPALERDSTAATQNIDEVTVVGSSIRTSQDYLVNARPIDVVTGEQFQRSSGEHLGDFLLQLPVNTGNAITPANDEYGGGSTNLNLRGLGSAYTLVLVDGHRFGGETFSADVGALPAEAVESVEILKGGASAVYGSDAVTGVVNVRLKKDFRGLSLHTSYGETSRHDAEGFRTAALFGFGDDKFHMTGSLAYQDRKGFTRSDRATTASRDYRARGGLDRRSTAIGTPHQIRLSSNPSQVLSIDVTRFDQGYYSGNLTDYVPYNHELQAYSTNEIGTYPPQDQVSGHWSAEYELLDDRAVLFTRGYANHRRQTFIAANLRPLLSVPASNPYNPFGEDVTVRYLPGSNEIDPWTWRFDTMDHQGVTGVEGRLGNYHYEVSFSSHRRRIRSNTENDIDLDALDAALARTDALAFNPFGYYANSPEQMALVRGPKTQTRSVDKNSIVSAKIDGKLFDWYAGESLFALGVEQRKVAYSFEPDYNARVYNNAFNDSYQTSPVSRSRRVNAVFGELQVPLYDGEGGFSSAAVTAAARREKYSDFGSSTVWQAAGSLGFLDDAVRFRASYAESFRAPTISALTDPVATDENPNAYFDPIRGGVFPLTYIYGGNPDLTPEMGESINVGLVFRPHSLTALTVTLDYWQVELKDVISEPDIQAVLFGTSAAGSVTRDPVTLYPTVDIRLANGGARKAAGIDLGTKYRLLTDGAGTVTFDFNATYLTKFEDVTSAGETIDYRGQFSFNPGPMPNLRAVAGVSWERGPFDASTSVFYTSSYDDVIPDVLSRQVEAYHTVNFQAGYQFTEGTWLNGTRIYAGVDNAFDADLPFVAASFDGWDRSLADYRGRYYYVGAKVAF